MNRLMQNSLLQLGKATYQQILRPIIYSRSAQQAHHDMLNIVASLDNQSLIQQALSLLHQSTFPQQPVTIGGVDLPNPLILGAGFVKGMGFETETEALSAVRNGINIIQGWRTMPSLVGAVEFGSYTRHPRIGNSGTVIWRDAETRSTQNRIGLKNPGAVAAASFLYQRRNLLPATFGINIAPSPASDSLEANKRDVSEALNAFISRGVKPSWFTLNISCPNTEDDPSAHQTTLEAYELSSIALETLRREGAGNIPLWVKISPNLSSEQYQALMKTFTETGVKAIISTNTIGQPTPEDPTIIAGVAGGRLHPYTLEAIKALRQAKDALNSSIDLIACGGIQDPYSYHHTIKHGAVGAQYLSALIFDGPLAPANILNEEHLYHEL
jgi:dihydroorotate dehydrogenase